MIKFSITLDTTEKLSKRDMKAYLDAVKEVVPSFYFDKLYKDGKFVNLIGRYKNGEYKYIIPLNRDINIYHYNDICKGLDKVLTTDYTLDYSKKDTEIKQLNKDSNEYKQLSYFIAKYMHNRWVHEKVKEGWRYGIHMDIQNKTNPLLVPFEQLNDSKKTIDEDVVGEILNKIEQFGFKIVQI